MVALRAHGQLTKVNIKEVKISKMPPVKFTIFIRRPGVRFSSASTN